jgi:hypothetical protein
LATLSDGTTIRVRTILLNLAGGGIDVQYDVSSAALGSKIWSYRLDNREVLDDDGDVVVAAGGATAWWRAFLSDPDHPETWGIAQIGADPSTTLVTRDMTAETGANGTAYLPRN